MYERKISYKDKIMYDFEFDMSVVEDNALKSTADTVQILTVKGYDLVITTHGDELSFNTYTDVGEPVSYYDAHKLFDMSDMIALKRGLLNMIEQHFYYGPPGSYLFYAPSCPRRDKIYMWWLKKLGYRVDAIDGIESYIILNK